MRSSFASLSLSRFDVIFDMNRAMLNPHMRHIPAIPCARNRSCGQMYTVALCTLLNMTYLIEIIAADKPFSFSSTLPSLAFVISSSRTSTKILNAFCFGLSLFVPFLLSSSVAQFVSLFFFFCFQMYFGTVSLSLDDLILLDLSQDSINVALCLRQRINWTWNAS